MAVNWGIRFDTRENCLVDLAASIGRFPPRDPTPPWWAEFEKWYQQNHTDNTVPTMLVRTESFTYEEDDGPNPDDPDGLWPLEINLGEL